MIFLKFKRLI